MHFIYFLPPSCSRLSLDSQATHTECTRTSSCQQFSPCLILLMLTYNQYASARLTYGHSKAHSHTDEQPLAPAVHTSTQSAKSSHQQPPLRHDCQRGDLCAFKICLMSDSGRQKWSRHTHHSPAVVFLRATHDRLNAGPQQQYEPKAVKCCFALKKKQDILHHAVCQFYLLLWWNMQNSL